MTIDYFTGDKIAEPSDYALPEVTDLEFHPSLREFCECSQMALERLGFSAYMYGPEYRRIDWQYSLSRYLEDMGYEPGDVAAWSGYGQAIYSQVYSSSVYKPKASGPRAIITEPPYHRLTAEHEDRLVNLADPNYLLPSEYLLFDFMAAGDKFEASGYEPTSPLYPLQGVTLRMGKIIARPSARDLEIATGVAYCEVRSLYHLGEEDGTLAQPYVTGAAAKVLVEYIRMPGSTQGKLIHGLASRTGLDTEIISSRLPFSLHLPELVTAVRKTENTQVAAGQQIAKNELSLAIQEISLLVTLGREMITQGVFEVGSPEEQFMQQEINDLYALLANISDKIASMYQLDPRRGLGIRALGKNALSLTDTGHIPNPTERKGKKKAKQNKLTTVGTHLNTPEVQAARRQLAELHVPHIMSRNQAKKLPFFNRMHQLMEGAERGDPYIIDASTPVDFVAICKIITQMHVQLQVPADQDEYLAAWFEACAIEDELITANNLPLREALLNLTKRWLITENPRLTRESDISYIPEIGTLSQAITDFHRRTAPES